MDRGGRRALDVVRWLLWLALLLTITVNSFPYFPFNVGFGEAVVRPLSLFPLIGLVLIDLLPRLITKERLPVLVIPLLVFFLIGAVSTVLASLWPSLPFRSQTAYTRGVRAIGTLAIGVAFYLETVLMTRTGPSRKTSLRVLYASLGLATLLGMFQWSRLLYRWPTYTQLDSLQRILSIRGLHIARVSGPSYEPSWFADQLVVLALPLLFASLVTGYRSMGKSRLVRFFEPIMFIASAVILAATYSRGGVLSFGLASLALGATMVLTHGRTIASWFMATAFDPSRPVGRWARIVGRVALVGVVAIVAIWLGRAIFIRSSYFSLLWVRLTQASSLDDYLKLVGAGPRLALAEGSIGVFAGHPWLGVGLGQSGFFLLDHIPLWAYDRRSEIMLLLASNSALFPNPKNLWARLLAETGIMGMTAFLLWMGIVFAASIYLMGRSDKAARFYGCAGMMMCVASVAEGFSLDSFALPTVWVGLGFITSAAWQELATARRYASGLE